METRDSSKMEAAVPESEIALHGEYCLSRFLSPPMTRTQYNSHLSGGECAGGVYRHLPLQTSRTKLGEKVEPALADISASL